MPRERLPGCSVLLSVIDVGEGTSRAHAVLACEIRLCLCTLGEHMHASMCPWVMLRRRHHTLRKQCSSDTFSKASPQPGSVHTYQASAVSCPARL
jgi:hypothetical protein